MQLSIIATIFLDVLSITGLLLLASSKFFQKPVASSFLNVVWWSVIACVLITVSYLLFKYSNIKSAYPNLSESGLDFYFTFLLSLPVLIAGALSIFLKPLRL
jgi:hypothetical protein